MEKRKAARIVTRVANLTLLVVLALFYLQFGLQALNQFIPQGILTLVGAIALGWGAVLTFRQRPASAIVFLGTVPLLLLHAVMTLLEPGELPFLLGSTPVPLLAGLAWLTSRRRRPAPRASA